ncbi:MAG TPA: hypothetical protein VFN48_09490 [Solirubrobacteraceae bacterium]|nr:hypothetical protein [Solirubrobacteraceae bacterium]
MPAPDHRSPDLAGLLAAAEALPGLTDVLDGLGRDFTPTLWLVGGPVRDLLLGRTPIDLDLMLAGDPEPVARMLDQSLRRHTEYLTASVGHIDIAQPRREHYPEPGALPHVQASASVAEDLCRRDFSVNAVALGLTGADRGRLVCADHALEDLAARQLRVLHDASFRDDPTRLLRLARYAARLDFSVEAHTLRLARAALEVDALQTVSGVRIGNELRRLAAEPDPVRAFIALGQLGIDERIDPALGLVDPALATRALTLLEPGDRRDRAVLAVALLGAPRERAAALLDRLGYPAADRELIVDIAARAQKVSMRLEYAGPPSEIDWAAGGPNAAPELIAVAGAIHPANAAREWLVELRHRRLAITGDDLIAAGIPAGPALGEGLRAARAAMLDDEAPDAASQLAVAVDAARAAHPG